MFGRRLSAFLVASVLALAFVMPVMAQDAGNTVTVNLMTCAMSGGLPSAAIADTANPSGIGRNCVAGWTGGGGLTFNGEDSSETTTTSQTWNGVQDGPASFSAPVAAISGADIVVTGDTILVATHYISDLDPNDPAPRPWSAGPVSIHVMECHVATVSESWIGDERGHPAGFDNCYGGDIESREWGLRVDGARPDSFSSNTAVWTGLADGTHIASTGRGAQVEFVVDNGGAVDLLAYYGPNQDPPIRELPNTGSGPESTSTSVGLALAAAAGIAALGARQARRQS